MLVSRERQANAKFQETKGRKFVSNSDMRDSPRPLATVATTRRSKLRSARRFERLFVLALLANFLPLVMLVSHAWATSVTFRAEPARSEFTIELGKAGLLKAFGDDHLIRVTDYRCDVFLDEQDLGNSSVKITIPTASLKVVDLKLDAEKRAEVQKRMEGPDVLDIARFPEITFVSRGVKVVGNGRFRLEGDLKIRDATRPVTLEVTLVPEGTARHVRGEARIRQTSFGIRPVTAVGGTIKVKDEMRIVFDLVLMPVAP